MGCQPGLTCSPYLLDTAPKAGEAIAWAGSNAVVYANAVLGAGTAKHPDFLDLCIALTGRAPLAAVYLDNPRRPARMIDIDLPDGIDDAFWPPIGYLAGKASPDRVPLLRGLAAATPARDDLCSGHDAYRRHRTRSRSVPVLPNADVLRLTRSEMAALRAAPSRAQAIRQM